MIVAAGMFDRLKNPNARMFAESTVKPTVSEKEKIVEMELGEDGHKKAVLDYKLKLLEKESGAVTNLAMHKASVRKAEKF